MTNIRGIGEAVYLEDKSTIQISKPNDWGWYHQDISEGFFLVVKVYKIFGKWWKAKITHHTENVKLKVIKVDVDSKNGLPYKVSAEIEKDGVKLHEFAFEKRVSISQLEKKNQTNTTDIEEAVLVEESGYYPSIFLFMLGAPNNGKTCWLHALSTSVVQQMLRDKGVVNFDVIDEDDPARPAPTLPKEVTLKHFSLDKGEGQAVAFVVDLAGEISKVKRNDSVNANTDAIGMITKKIKKLAAGVFIVRNEDWLFNRSRQIEFDPEKLIFNDLKENPQLKDKFCYILTGLDKIKEALDGKELDENLRKSLVLVNLIVGNDNQYNRLKEVLATQDEDQKQYEDFKKIKLTTDREAQYEDLKDFFKEHLEEFSIKAIKELDNKEELRGNPKLKEKLKDGILKDALKKIDLIVIDREKQYEKLKKTLEEIGLGISDEKDKRLKDVFGKIDLMKENTEAEYKKLKETLDGMGLTIISEDVNKKLKDAFDDISFEKHYENFKQAIGVTNNPKLREYLLIALQGITFEARYKKLKEAFKKIQEKDRKLKRALCNGIRLSSGSPIFCRQDDDDQMYKNMAITSNIMNNLIKDSPCFAVSCCSDYRNERGSYVKAKGQILLDFGRCYNVTWPLIYMLQKLIKLG